MFGQRQNEAKEVFLLVVTVTLVVFSVTLLQNAIEQSPVMFLKLAEDGIVIF